MNWNNVEIMIAPAMRAAKENPTKSRIEMLEKHFKMAVKAEIGINVYQELQDEIDKIHKK